jgi:hypothetical protein
MSERRTRFTIRYVNRGLLGGVVSQNVDLIELTCLASVRNQFPGEVTETAGRLFHITEDKVRGLGFGGLGPR